LPAVFGVFFLVVFYFDLAFYREIDQLADGHAFVNTNGLFAGDLQCPVAAETYITFTGSGMYIDAETAGRRFSFKKRNMRMCFGIFFGYA
jgi:hypothetical protein